MARRCEMWAGHQACPQKAAFPAEGVACVKARSSACSRPEMAEGLKLSMKRRQGASPLVTARREGVACEGSCWEEPACPEQK